MQGRVYAPKKDSRSLIRKISGLIPFFKQASAERGVSTVRAGGGLSPEVCTLLTEANTSSILITDLAAEAVELPLRVLFRPTVEEAPGASLEASAISLNSIRQHNEAEVYANAQLFHCTPQREEWEGSF